MKSHDELMDDSNILWMVTIHLCHSLKPLSFPPFANILDMGKGY